MSKRCSAKISRASKETCKIKQIRLQPTILRRKRKAEPDESEVCFEEPLCSQFYKRQLDIQNQMMCLSVSSLPDNDSASESCKETLRTPPDPLSSGELRFRGLTCMSTPETCTWRFSPLPSFSWADANEVWELMINKDRIYKRDSELMSRHPALHARMRSILLDWLMEVCEVYQLHRATYYLAQDFIDRYLATQSNVPKQHLQLLGITSLFVAAKTEEIYPPKLSDFAYVTDEACTEDEIREKELVILKVLNWNLTPMTVNNWLNVYLQLLCNQNLEHNNGDRFIFPDYSRSIFIQVSQIVDLCMLDLKCLQYPYSVIAASALCHLTSRGMALDVSGFDWHHISSCVQWIAPFAETIKRNGFAEMKLFHQINPDEVHRIQTHSVNLQLLESAQSCLVKTDVYSSPPTSPSFPTPPQSTEKFKCYVQETP